MKNSSFNLIDTGWSEQKEMYFKDSQTPINICGYNNMTAQTIRLYSPISDKLVSVKPYSRKAKIIYRPYIDILGWSPDSFLPTGLQFKNNRFQLTQKTHTIAP